jgi:aminopeptidase N
MARWWRASPTGPRRGSPVTTTRAAKASYRIAISTDKPVLRTSPTASWSKRTRAARPSWTYEQPEPTSTYLVTLQIGDYTLRAWRSRRCR